MIIRRFIISILGISIGFGLSLRGYQHFDRQRRLLGASLVAIGSLFTGSGILLFWITGFSWSWNWVL